MKDKIFSRIAIEMTSNNKHEKMKKDSENGKPNEEDDYLVKTIGAFGLWQAVVSVTVILTRVIAMWNMMSLPFLAPVTEFFCVEFSDNVTTEVQNSICYDNCNKYKYSSVIGRTIIEDFELICQNAWMAGFTQSVLMMGIFIGVSLFGWISDRFGRRSALIQSTFLNAMLMIALPFSPTYVIFTSIRFLIGIATGGSLIICVVQVIEITGKQYREIAGACCLMPDGLAQASLAGFAYFSADWQSYTLSYGVATCFIFILILFTPESPRWLVSHGKVDEAVKVVTCAAKRNKLNTSHIKAEITKAVEDLKCKNCESVESSYLDFFKSKTLFTLTLTVFAIWFCMGMCFFGIYQFVTIIGFDPYLTVVLLGFIQIPFCPLGIIVNWRFGRKISIIGVILMIALLMLVLVFVPTDGLFGTMLGILALICCNISFSIAYVYVSELYPTPLRNMSFAFSLGGTRVGAMITPFVAILTPRWLPSLIFCVISLIAGLCCLTLPETKGRNLKDVI